MIKSSILCSSRGLRGLHAFRLSGNAVKSSIPSVPVAVGWPTPKVAVVDMSLSSKVLWFLWPILVFSFTGLRFFTNNKVCSSDLDALCFVHPPGYTQLGIKSHLIGGWRHGSCCLLVPGAVSSSSYWFVVTNHLFVSCLPFQVEVTPFISFSPPAIATVAGVYSVVSVVYT